MSHKRVLRRWARALIRALEGALHPWRRRRATARVRHRGVQRVLFVCHGNICRSPFAAHTARRRIAAQGRDGVVVASAGVIGPDRPCPPEALAAAAALGVDLSRHRSRLLTPAIVRDAGLIVVMDARQADTIRRGYGRGSSVIVLGDLDPQPITARTIPDPVDKPRPAFDACYARIDRCVVAMLDHAARPGDKA
jgi:protein-tyrosine-phosphatase